MKGVRSNFTEVTLTEVLVVVSCFRPRSIVVAYNLFAIKNSKYKIIIYIICIFLNYSYFPTILN